MSYKTNINTETSINEFFRKVIFTGRKSQLVLMNIKPNEDIGEEVHPNVEQYLFNLSGNGRAIVNDLESDFLEGDVLVIEPGEKHNVVNTGNSDLKIYTIYVPANHIESRIHKTKEDAENDIEDEEFGHRVE